MVHLVRIVFMLSAPATYTLRLYHYRQPGRTVCHTSVTQNHSLERYHPSWGYLQTSLSAEKFLWGTVMVVFCYFIAINNDLVASESYMNRKTLNRRHILQVPRIKRLKLPSLRTKALSQRNPLYLTFGSPLSMRLSTTKHFTSNFARSSR
jgi:hypothetical protein